VKADWRKVPLGELVELKYGKALKAEERPENGHFPVYGSNGIVGTSDNALVDHPTIVIGRKGAVGEAHLAEHGCWPIDTTFYTSPRPGTNFSLHYLLLCIRSIDLKQVAITSTIPGLNRDTLASQIILVPPLPEQERIVQILHAAEELWRLRAQADRRTADLIPALFHNMFGDHASGSQSWKVSTVANVAAKREGSIRTGPFGSDLHHSEFIEEGIPVLGIENVVSNEFRWTRARCITPEKYKGFTRFRVYPGDVLVTIMGTVGRVSVAPDDIPECMSTKHLCVVTVDRQMIDPTYLWGTLLFDERLRGQTRRVSSGAIMDGWNSTIIKGLPIRVPPLPLQRKFAARVQEIRALEERQAQSRRRLDDLFASLLHRAFKVSSDVAWASSPCPDTVKMTVPHPAVAWASSPCSNAVRMTLPQRPPPRQAKAADPPSRSAPHVLSGSDSL